MMKIFKWVYKKKHTLLYAGFFILFFITLFPGSKLPHIPNWKNLLQPDKIIHVLMFTGMMFVLLLNIQKYKYWENILVSFLIGLFLASITEILQGILPINRSMNIYDMIANAIGLIFGFLLWKITIRKIK